MIELPTGSHDLRISAPGHLAVIVPGVSLEPGESVVIPSVTLAFGDADGDGAINLLDLFLVARNFGAATRAISPQ